VEITLWGDMKKIVDPPNNQPNGIISVLNATFKMYQHSIQLGVSESGTIRSEAKVTSGQGQEHEAALQTFQQLDEESRSAPTPQSFCCSGCKESSSTIISLLAEIKQQLESLSNKKTKK